VDALISICSMFMFIVQIILEEVLVFVKVVDLSFFFFFSSLIFQIIILDRKYVIIIIINTMNLISYVIITPLYNRNKRH